MVRCLVELAGAVLVPLALQVGILDRQAVVGFYPGQVPGGNKFFAHDMVVADGFLDGNVMAVFRFLENIAVSHLIGDNPSGRDIAGIYRFDFYAGLFQGDGADAIAFMLQDKGHALPVKHRGKNVAPAVLLPLVHQFGKQFACLGIGIVQVTFDGFIRNAAPDSAGDNAAGVERPVVAQESRNVLFLQTFGGIICREGKAEIPHAYGVER